jgi:excinuclease ABC subunit B
MERAISETDRRRSKQIAHNTEHGIIPQGVQKSVLDIMESAVPGARSKSKKRDQKVEDIREKYRVNVDAMSIEQMTKTIKQLEKQMLESAKNLEFEQAGAIRDEIHRIRDKAFIA